MVDPDFRETLVEFELLPRGLQKEQVGWGCFNKFCKCYNQVYCKALSSM